LAITSFALAMFHYEKLKELDKGITLDIKETHIVDS
jgi:hypothetical protein